VGENLAGFSEPQTIHLEQEELKRLFSLLLTAKIKFFSDTKIENLENLIDGSFCSG